MTKKIADIADIAILKDGQSIDGEVLVKVFTQKTKYGVLTFKKEQVLAIDFSNPPTILEDEVQVSAGTRTRGSVAPASIPIRISGTTQVINIPTSDLVNLTFLTGIHQVSAKTRRILAALR